MSKERRDELRQKRELFLSKSEEQRIQEFIEKYKPDTMLMADDWILAHSELTGSCGIGAYKFIRSKGIKRYEKYSTLEFLDIVGEAYASTLIEKVKEHYLKEVPVQP